MRKKMYGLLLAVFMLNLLLVGCSSNSPSATGDTSKTGNTNNASSTTNTTSKVTDTSWEDIQKKGYFILGLDDAFPPMGFKDEKGEIVGLDIDLAKEVAKKLGVEVKFQPVSWDGIILELNNKNIDVIWNGMTITEERQQKIAFTRPYLANRQIVVVKKDSDIKSKADLAGKVVGLQAGSSSRVALEKNVDVYESVKDKLVEFASNDEVLLDLRNGGIDAAIVDEVVGRYYISKRPDTYEVLTEDFGDEEYGIGVRKGEDAFVKKLNEAMDELKAEGISATISEKWFGADIIQ